MDEKKTIKPQDADPCPWCSGTGQISFFGGESRFMFTWEDCPDCSGTGVVLENPGETQNPRESE